MTVRSVLPRALVAAAAAVTALVPAPASAVPPFVVIGSGTVSPGVSIQPQPQSFAFSGTATAASLVTHPCSFQGSSTVGSASSFAGTMSGSCGPYVYASCTFTFTLTNWDFVCSNGSVGAFTVSPDNLNPTTSFDATGTVW